jgi:hypothetical protein
MHKSCIFAQSSRQQQVMYGMCRRIGEIACAKGDSAAECWHNPPLGAPMAKLVDARDLKSLDFGCAGSTPAGRTNTVTLFKPHG